MSALDHPAFADPTAASQTVFRALLDAMARPGTIHRVAELTPPPPLHSATAAVLLTLVDGETSLHADPVFAPCREWIAFHCGIAPDAERHTAAYALCAALPGLDALAAGSDLAPEDGATVILQIAALGQGPALRLQGPGLAAPATLRAAGLPADFTAWWQANQRRFPRGVDLLLCAGRDLAALPRSVSVAG